MTCICRTNSRLVLWVLIVSYVILESYYLFRFRHRDCCADSLFMFLLDLAYSIVFLWVTSCRWLNALILQNTCTFMTEICCFCLFGFSWWATISIVLCYHAAVFCCYFVTVAFLSRWFSVMVIVTTFDMFWNYRPCHAIFVTYWCFNGFLYAVSGAFRGFPTSFLVLFHVQRSYANFEWFVSMTFVGTISHVYGQWLGLRRYRCFFWCSYCLPYVLEQFLISYQLFDLRL